MSAPVVAARFQYLGEWNIILSRLLQFTTLHNQNAQLVCLMRDITMVPFLKCTREGVVPPATSELGHAATYLTDAVRTQAEWHIEEVQLKSHHIVFECRASNKTITVAGQNIYVDDSRYSYLLAWLGMCIDPEQFVQRSNICRTHSEVVRNVDPSRWRGTPFISVDLDRMETSVRFRKVAGATSLSQRLAHIVNTYGTRAANHYFDEAEIAWFVWIYVTSAQWKEGRFVPVWILNFGDMHRIDISSTPENTEFPESCLTVDVCEQSSEQELDLFLGAIAPVRQYWREKLGPIHPPFVTAEIHTVRSTGTCAQWCGNRLGDITRGVGTFMMQIAQIWMNLLLVDVSDIMDAATVYPENEDVGHNLSWLQFIRHGRPFYAKFGYTPAMHNLSAAWKSNFEYLHTKRLVDVTKHLENELHAAERIAQIHQQTSVLESMHLSAVTHNVKVWRVNMIRLGLFPADQALYLSNVLLWGIKHQPEQKVKDIIPVTTGASVQFIQAEIDELKSILQQIALLPSKQESTYGEALISIYAQSPSKYILLHDAIGRSDSRYATMWVDGPSRYMQIYSRQ